MSAYLSLCLHHFFTLASCLAFCLAFNPGWTLPPNLPFVFHCAMLSPSLLPCLSKFLILSYFCYTFPCLLTCHLSHRLPCLILLLPIICPLPCLLPLSCLLLFFLLYRLTCLFFFLLLFH